MKLLEDLRTVLANLAPVTAIVATNPASADKAIRPERLFQKDPFPAIALNLKRANPLNDLGGSSKEFNSEVLVSCVGSTAKQANDLAETVKDQLEPWRGATAHGFIESITYVDERTGFEPFDDKSDAGAYINELMLQVFYRQTS